MDPLSRAYTAARLRLLRPVVQVRGAVLRRLAPPRPSAPDATLDKIPIVVLGCHRSGTSLLRRCIDSHSRLACPAETLFLESIAALLDYPDAEKGLAAIGMTVDDAAEDLRGMVEGWMQRHARAQGKPRWVDKSPGLLAHLDGMDRLFGPEARYIAIVRDGMDVATSLGGASPRWWQLDPYIDPTDPSDAAGHLAACRYWVDRNQRLRRFLDAHPQQCHLLRYEDLVASPEVTLSAALASVGEAWEPEVLDFNRHAHVGGLEDHHVSTTTKFEDNSGKHRGLSQPLQVRMWDLVGDTMSAFGYEPRSYTRIG